MLAGDRVSGTDADRYDDISHNGSSEFRGNDDSAEMADLNFGLRTAECIAQCSNLEHEFHHAVSKLCILGFEPLK
jgi:hypothetical protein